jgi:hypothetical protein
LMINRVCLDAVILAIPIKLTPSITPLHFVPPDDVRVTTKKFLKFFRCHSDFVLLV